MEVGKLRGCLHDEGDIALVEEEEGEEGQVDTKVEDVEARVAAATDGVVRNAVFMAGSG